MKKAPFYVAAQSKCDPFELGVRRFNERVTSSFYSYSSILVTYSSRLLELLGELLYLLTSLD